MQVSRNIKDIMMKLPADVTLVAVSKFHPANIILEAYESGQRVFGESRVQEFIEKQKVLPKDISWHFIGHLQTNKVKSIIGKTSLIESVDSEKLLDTINSESIKAGVITDILLQVHVAAEDTKFGFFPKELTDLIHSGKFSSLKGIRVRGIMGMATNTEDSARIKEDFVKIHDIYQGIFRECAGQFPQFNILSMGMSGDWPIAVEEGSNNIRIGSAIFGERA